eukprot:TRINITY_DN3909_c0_g1_i1.p1 TRINITY_DN3909_c0_g1~~TRINITY_DN3909_c0_g1_i1.p1  ORF type:complete len:688 (+),score=153.17 TRINITY_DN3909_c0_g1_i1:48-2111(+)
MRAGLVVMTCATAAMGMSRIDVHNTEGSKISKTQYSMFFETEINFGSEGGMYGELVWNRDFEALGRGTIDTESKYKKRATPSTAKSERELLQEFELSMKDERPKYGNDPPGPDEDDFRPWSTTGKATAAISSVSAPYLRNPHVLALNTTGNGDGVMNPGYWGMNLPNATLFNVSLFAKSDDVTTFTLQLRCGTVVTAYRSFNVNSTWTLQEADIITSTKISCSDGNLFIQPHQKGVLYLDHVSAFPADSVSGLFRPDLLKYLKDFKPALLRLPGGNYLEGISLDSRWAWKETIGDRRQRAGHYSPWNYWVTDGMGLHELLVLCELIETEPLVSIYTGYSMTKKYVPLNESWQFAQDALDLIEYANGNTSTYWGGKRAANGHPDPFNVKYLEIGNEEQDMSSTGFPPHYKMISEAVWERYPDIFVVASGSMIASSAPGHRSKSCFPCVGGCGFEPQRCDSWDEHTYDSPQTMADLHTLYDNYTKTCRRTDGKACPPVFVLEYAARSDPFLQNAIAEGMFLIGAEKNAEVVQGTSFAPLFCNVHGTQWKYNLLSFNSSSSFALPSYYVQKILKENLGDNLLKTTTSGTVSNVTWNATASIIKTSNEVVLKMVNFGEKEVNLEVVFHGFASVKPSKTVQIVTSEKPTDANTLDDPTYITDTTATIDSSSNPLKFMLPAMSVVVLRASVEL